MRLKLPKRKKPPPRPSAAAGPGRRPRRRASGTGPSALSAAYGEEFIVDLKRRRDQLVARVAELQWDLGGLVYEMAIRNSIRVEVLVKRAAVLQDADAELNEVERILRMEETGDRRLLPLLRRPPLAAARPSAGSAANRCSSRSRATRSSRALRRSGSRAAAQPKRPVT